MSKRVLVVEDQEDNREILRALLESIGHQMIEAFDGEAAVAKAIRARAEEDARAPLYTNEQERALMEARRCRAIAALDEG